MNPGISPHPSPLPVGEGVRSQPWRASPLPSHPLRMRTLRSASSPTRACGERDRVRGDSPGSLRPAPARSRGNDGAERKCNCRTKRGPPPQIEGATVTEFNLAYPLCGFLVGGLVGFTGIGGGSIMTPLLILLFGVHPLSAVGTDLLYAAATKAAGSQVHARKGRRMETCWLARAWVRAGHAWRPFCCWRGCPHAPPR